MIISANVACYIQPIIDTRLLKAAGIAHVDINETAIIRGIVESAAEAQQVIDRAREVARAMGRPVAIKKVVCRWGSDRLPRGVKALQGLEVFNVV